MGRHMKIVTIASIVVLVLLCGTLVYWIYSGTSVSCCVKKDGIFKVCQCEDGNLGNNWSCSTDTMKQCTSCSNSGPCTI